MKQPKGLGRGLDAIFGTDAVDAKLKPMSQMTEIDIAEIIPNPTQPRTQFDEEALDELADSIRQLGIIQPITVKKSGDGKYIIISGERRWRAAQRADLKSLPAYVREVDDENLHAMALVENIQRQDLNAIEIALGMQRLIEECNLTQDALSEKVGKKRSTVSNYMRLLKLPDEVQLALKEGLISMGHAKAIAGAPQELQLRTLKKILKKSLSVRQAEELVRTHQVHILEYDSLQWHNYVDLRDYMNAFPEKAREYEALKIRLQKECNNVQTAYTDGKQGYMEHTLAEARAYAAGKEQD